MRFPFQIAWTRIHNAPLPKNGRNNYFLPGKTSSDIPTNEEICRDHPFLKSYLVDKIRKAKYNRDGRPKNEPVLNDLSRVFIS